MCVLCVFNRSKIDSDNEIQMHFFGCSLAQLSNWIAHLTGKHVFVLKKESLRDKWRDSDSVPDSDSDLLDQRDTGSGQAGRYDVKP